MGVHALIEQCSTKIGVNLTHQGNMHEFAPQDWTSPPNPYAAFQDPTSKRRLKGASLGNVFEMRRIILRGQGAHWEMSFTSSCRMTNTYSCDTNLLREGNS
mmetsp:Transcript_28198/g.51378  ORF Transcript_28198/g.51378 Transcript_28198/m.51378 type:complete len:101 (+) Transcript_28198:32-334(+)